MSGEKTPTSDELIERIRNHDAEAVAEVFTLYRNRLRRMVKLRLDRRLQGRVDPSDVLQEAWLKQIHGTAFTTDGKSLVAHGDDGFAVFETGEFTQTSLVRLDTVSSVSFSPDSRLMAFSTFLSRKIRLWNLHTHHEVAYFENTDKHRDVSISHDGQWLASVGTTSVRFQRLRGLPEKLTLRGHSEMVVGCAFSHEGDMLATAGKDKAVRVWETATGKLLHTIELEGMGQTVDFSPDDRLLAIGEYPPSGNVLIWDVREKRVLAKHKLSGVFRVKFSPRENTVATAGRGLTLLDLRRRQDASGALAVELEVREIAPGVRSLSLDFSPDGKWIAYAHRNNKLLLWDAVNDQPVDRFPRKNLLLHGWHNMAFLPDSGEIIFVGVDGLPQIWNVESGRLAYKIEDTRKFAAYHIAISADGRWFAGDATGQALTIIDMKNRQELLTLADERSPIKSISWSRDNKRIAIGLANGAVVIWNFDEIRDRLTKLGVGWKY